MEDLYTLPDGSTVDISKYSELERMQFLLNNEGAKKSKGGTKSAVVAPKSKQALPKNTGSKSVNGPSSSQKFRLPTVDELQKKGQAPPPSASASAEVVDISKLYDMVANTGKLITSNKKKNTVKDLYDLKQNSIEHVNSEEEVKNIKNKIQQNDSDLIYPHLFYSSTNQGTPDDFVNKNYNASELKNTGVDPDDFDGFLNKKGYKNDFLKKEAEGIYEGTGNATLSRYDIGLAKELAKKKMLNLYMEDMQKRDFTRQDLNQDLEIVTGNRKEKQIVQNDIFDPVGISKYVEKNFPIVTQKLKDRDVENRKIYDESKKGGTDFFSWDTVGKMGKSGWNAVVDRTKQISATVYDAIGMDATAEGIRALDEENKFIRPDDRGVSYASGKTASYNGNDYLVDSRGEIYDKDAKIRVTDLFDESEYKNIVETSKYGPSDWMFSPQGAAVQTSGVMADMLIQAAVTRGVGQFGAIASEARIALNGARQTSKFTSLLNDSSQLLRKLPLDRATGYSMIAQGALGYSQGYEDTLKAARDSGINDSEAFKLASTAAQRMAVLYSTTGVINPQTKLAENIFGSRNVIKKAINQYLKTGEKGFVGYIDNIIKSTPRNLVEFAEEGGKEVVQENIQQAGEIGVNRLTNEQAGKKIMNDTMTGDDFMNTSILSFLSSGLISKMKMPSFKAGNQDTDNLSSLSTLAKNKKEFVKIVDNLATEKVFTQEQVDNLKSDVDIYSNNINKMPKDTSSKAAMPILRSLDKIQKLKDEKESLDKAFHPSIDEKIKEEEVIANSLYNTDRLEAKTKLIQNAIKKGVIKNIEMKSFSDDNSIVKYLTEELNMSEDEAKSYADSGGFFLDENLLKEYSKDPSSIVKGQKLIVINEDYAIRTGNVEAAQHEFLHGLIHETIKNDPEAQQLLGRSLTKELMKMKDKVDIEGTGETPLPQVFKDRFSLYIKKYQKEIAKVNADLELGKISKEEHDAEVDSLIGDQWEEALTIYSDAISNGSVKYDEGTFSKLKDVIRQVLQNLGVKNIKFESGKDVYNFLKDYNQSVKTGNFGIASLGAMRKLGSQKAEINREKLREETGARALNVEQTPSVTSKVKLSLGGDRRSVEKKSSEDIKKDVDNAYNKETFTQKTNSQRDPLLFDIVEEYEYLIRGKAKSEGFFNLPGFEKDKKEREKDFVQETKFELISHIRNFNKEFLALREEYKQNLISNGFDPNSKEFKEILDAKDAEGYKGKKGIVKENNSLNGWINSQILNKMKNALKKAGIVDEKFNLDVEGENFVEGRGTTDIGETPDYLLGDSVDVMEATEDFNEEQEKLANILKDPVFRFVDEKGEDVIIDTVPERGDYVISAKDQGIEANKQLKTETDPARIEELKSDLIDLQRGLDLQNKEEPLTPEEKQELKSLKPTKAFNLTTGNVEYVFKAIIKKESPAKIIARQVAEEILRSPNVETLEFRNFKKLLADKSMTMMKRITFETGEGLESLMYNNWKLVYDVINNPVDEVTGQSSYASKKIPPYLKERNEKGEFQKVVNINRSVFLQSFYSEEDAKKIIRKYNPNNPEEEIAQFLEYEQLTTNAWFDRRTALRELFGDVMVLQEARRLLRNPDFIEQIGIEKPNLYNSLKDDVIRTQVLNNLAKGKSSRVKFSLSPDNKENKEFLKNFPNLLKSKEYNTFKNRIRDIYHSGSEIEENWKKHDIKAIWFSAGASQGWYGDGTLYKSDLASLPGSIVMPDWNRSGDAWNERFTEKFPEIQEALLRDMYDSNKNPEYVRDENGEITYEDDPTFGEYLKEKYPNLLAITGNVGIVEFVGIGTQIGANAEFEDVVDEYEEKYNDFRDATFEEYLETKFPRIFNKINKTGVIDLDEFIEFGESRNQGDIFKKIARDYIKRNVDRKPLIKKLTFEEFKENELEFEPPTPGIFWLLKPENIKYADKVILEYIKGYEEDPDSYLNQTEGGMNNPDGTLGDYTELIVIGPMKGQKIEKLDKEGKYSRIKLSLSEKANAAINPLLSGLNLTQQSVIARDIDKAIMNGKLSELAKNTEMDKLTAKLKKQTDPIKIKEVRKEMSDLFQADTVPFKVPRMSKSTDKAIATFIINKMAEGYNSFDFHVKKNADGPLTKQVLNALDANSKKIKQTAFRNSNLELTMNEIIEENKGIPKTEIFSEETAKNIGKGKKLDWAYLPPGDEDFEGLLYKLASGKGAMGEAQLEFFNENLIIPYSEAMIDLMVARQKMYGDWKDVVTNQHKGIIKLLTTQTDYEGFTYDQAVRVYLWDEAKYKIPGINNRDKFNLTNIVRTNPKLKDFANSVSLLSKQANGYVEPEKNWSYGSILGDMNNIISTVNRAKYLQDWQNRADKIFSKENLTKIEAVYGGEYVKWLKNMLARLKSGTNRDPGGNSKLLDWLNKSTANVMFLNTRSSVLQLLGSVNFINTSDNNIAQAALAFANLPQYWKDVKYLWKSPYLKDRRSGLMNDVAEAEIAQLMDSQKGDDSINKYKRIVNWLRVNGFIGSRVFDAIAIATGGATFYRNRINTYKKQGYTEEQAEKKTMADFYQTSEKSQQSADVSKISGNQASKTGRILLSFMNTPFQYSRIMKKAAIDIAKGRGDLANNVSKLVFYGVLQNTMFNALQNLIFATMWGDDDDEEEAKQKDSKQRTLRTLNGILDGIVRGMGMQYVALSVVKNALMKWYDTTGTPQATSAPILELANISPMVGIKARQIDKAIKAIEYNKELNPEGDKVIPTRAIVEASCSFISVTANLPADRIYQKVQNIRGALDSQNEDWQRIALAFGFSEQNLGIKKEKEQTGSAISSGLKSPGLSGGGLKSPGLK